MVSTVYVRLFVFGDYNAQPIEQRRTAPHTPVCKDALWTAARLHLGSPATKSTLQIKCQNAGNARARDLGSLNTAYYEHTVYYEYTTAWYYGMYYGYSRGRSKCLPPYSRRRSKCLPSYLGCLGRQMGARPGLWPI